MCKKELRKVKGNAMSNGHNFSIFCFLKSAIFLFIFFYYYFHCDIQRIRYFYCFYTCNYEKELMYRDIWNKDCLHKMVYMSFDYLIVTIIMLIFFV